jgi:hypothetical protein
MTAHSRPHPPRRNRSDAGWFKSPFSDNDVGCVETRFLEDGSVQLRDTKDRGGPILTFDSVSWDAFIKGAKAGYFDFHR